MGLPSFFPSSNLKDKVSFDGVDQGNFQLQLEVALFNFPTSDLRGKVSFRRPIRGENFQLQKTRLETKSES